MSLLHKIKIQKIKSVRWRTNWFRRNFLILIFKIILRLVVSLGIFQNNVHIIKIGKMMQSLSLNPFDYNSKCTIFPMYQWKTYLLFINFWNNYYITINSNLWIFLSVWFAALICTSSYFKDHFKSKQKSLAIKASRQIKSDNVFKGLQNIHSIQLDALPDLCFKSSFEEPFSIPYPWILVHVFRLIEN